MKCLGNICKYCFPDVDKMLVNKTANYKINPKFNVFISCQCDPDFLKASILKMPFIQTHGA